MQNNIQARVELKKEKREQKRINYLRIKSLDQASTSTMRLHLQIKVFSEKITLYLGKLKSSDYPKLSTHTKTYQFIYEGVSHGGCWNLACDLLLLNHRAAVSRTWTIFLRPPGSSCEWIVGRCGCLLKSCSCSVNARVSKDKFYVEVKKTFLCAKNRNNDSREIRLNGLISLKWLWSAWLSNVWCGLWVDRAGRNTPWFSGFNIHKSVPVNAFIN